MCYLPCKAQKNHHFSQFKPGFKFLVKSKMATIVGDVTGLQQRHHPQNIPHLVKKIKGFQLEVKIISTYCNMSKTPGRGSIHPPPPCTTVMIIKSLRKPSESIQLKLQNIDGWCHLLEQKDH